MGKIDELVTMTAGRKHPDLFNAVEALEYLHLAEPTDRTLETLRQSHGLVCFSIGKVTMYHRRHLDSLVERLAGMDQRSSTDCVFVNPKFPEKPVSKSIRASMLIG